MRYTSGVFLLVHVTAQAADWTSSTRTTGGRHRFKSLRRKS